ncbi:MAG TPA: serine hydrolase domain-containing protein, partial [Thermoanaerobaculia bacterium]
MKIKLLTIAAVLLLALPAAAQRRVMRMGGQNIDVDELTKDWPKLARPAGTTDDAMTAAVAAYVDALGTRGMLSGTVVLAKNGKPLLERAYGLANRDHGVKNNVDTKYNVAGLSKLFTDLAIYQLEEQGKLALTDTLRKHLPDYPNAIADRATIADLMAHRSGIADFVGPEFDAVPKDRLRELRDFLPLFAAKPADTSGRVPFSNAGYIVLGLVIEKVSGLSYADY